MRSINKIMALIVMLLINMASVASPLTKEAEFDVRINFVSLLTVEKITDIDFGDVYIDSGKQNIKASGKFKVKGTRNIFVKFSVKQTQELTNGDQIIPMKTYVSNYRNGRETQTGLLSTRGEYYGNLVAELDGIKGVKPGKYTGMVTLTVEYN